MGEFAFACFFFSFFPMDFFHLRNVLSQSERSAVFETGKGLPTL